MSRWMVLGIGGAMMACAGCADGETTGQLAGGGGAGGRVEEECPAGLTACGTSCVDLAIDEAACGRCGNVCSETRQCVLGICQSDCGSQTSCRTEGASAACVEVNEDPQHCGGCQLACAPGESCQKGACVATCPSGRTSCDGSCVDTMSAVDHCGGCGVACSLGSCVDGSCQCAPGLVLCGGACVDTTNDPGNCGACDAGCASTRLCSRGECVVACGAGETRCGRACVDLASARAHCGACDSFCDGACVDGACTCEGNLTACSGTCVATRDDFRHCGACGHACAPGQTCTNGACVCGAPTDVSFSAEIQPMLSTSCDQWACHNSQSQSSSLHLAEGFAYAELLNEPAKQCPGAPRPRVVPGAPEASYLMDKITGIDMCIGNEMPPPGAWTAAQAALLTRWICEGAHSN